MPTATVCWRSARAGDTKVVVPTYTALEAYRAAGGYQLLRKLRDGAIAAEQLIAIVDKAGLRGLGGAGFPTGRKWRAVLGEPGRG